MAEPVEREETDMAAGVGLANAITKEEWGPRAFSYSVCNMAKVCLQLVAEEAELLKLCDQLVREKGNETH